MQRRTFLTVLAAGHVAACSRPTGNTLGGITMGTTYSVTIPAAPARRLRASLHAEIEHTLASIVGAMSTYDRSSELSQLNRSDSTQWQSVSPELFTVLEAAVRAGAVTRGAFDVTVGPLVQLWGFGPAMRNATLPGAGPVERARARVGMHQLRLDSRSQAVAKRRPDVQIDLSSIAKGYGVDRVAALLEARGMDDYLVEIGGEIRVRGANATQRTWRIAIDAPPAGERRTSSIIELDGDAVATSGNYRDFFEHGGRRYPHVLDPETGEPVDHAPMSVTVVAESAMWADALATALLIMGPKVGHRFASATGVAALFIELEGETLRTRCTRAMQPLLAS